MKNYVRKGILIFVIILIVAFGLEFLNLGWTRFFAPKRANIEREVFENTKSYTHGKIQDLAKYYEEHTKADNVEDKEVIESLIKMNFAEFDETKITNRKLKSFLIDTRGY